MKILEVPREFKQMLTPFRQFMTAPQFKHFTGYVFELIVAEIKKKRLKESLPFMERESIAAI